MTPQSWTILSNIEQRIKKKIEEVGVPLKDWDISINRGILTGLNEAFIITGEKKDELIALDPKSAEIIRPILRGRDIKRYEYNFSDLWLLHIPWHFPLQHEVSIVGASEIAEAEFIKQYPSVYNHLLFYKDQLLARNRAETGIRYEWYALQRWGANYWEDFYKQKLVWTPVNSEYRFAVIPAGIFFNNSLFMITGKEIMYLCGIMNSRIFRYYLNLLLAGNSYTYGSGSSFENLPLPKMENTMTIETLVETIIINRKENLNTQALENQIDDYLFDFYGLAEDEKDIVKSSTEIE